MQTYIFYPLCLRLSIQGRLCMKGLVQKMEEKMEKLQEEKTDILIVGTGAAGLYCALNIPEDKKVCMITKDIVEHSDSFLAQGGICVLKSEEDYESYFEDTMRAGHYKNNRASVETMIRSSQDIIHDLIGYGVEFERENGELRYTKEGAHSTARILFHEDLTGKEITSKLLENVQKRENVEIREYVTMIDIIGQDNTCTGVVVKGADDKISVINADYVVLASGGIGGLYEHSTNFRHLTADAIAIALKHGIKIQDINYVQIHPTTLYSPKPGRRFLISESVRGEGAVLYNKNKERFVDELLPRDVVTQAIKKEMEKDGTKYVWLSMKEIGADADEIIKRFPNIYRRCLEEGYDITKECIPVTPAQHYFMGGIQVNLDSKTSMDRLYAIGETSCNGVHGANRLASNSLLEGLVFAKRAVKHMMEHYAVSEGRQEDISLEPYQNLDALKEEYKEIVMNEIERINSYGKSYNNESKCG